MRWKRDYRWMLVLRMEPRWERSPRSGAEVLWTQDYGVPIGIQRLAPHVPYPTPDSVLHTLDQVLDVLGELVEGDDRVVLDVELLHARLPNDGWVEEVDR